MFRRKEAAASEQYASSNIKLLLVASAFLAVTIVLILLQPGSVTQPIEQVATAPVTAKQTGVEATVTRADASLLDLQTVPASEAVSRQLRQPIRLTDTDARHTDLRSLTSAVLIGFGHTPQQGDRLQALLVQALTEGQSNAYIDALLNTAAARGEFSLPRQLTTATGRLDTEALLVALVRQSQG
ncbi:hypothetical protein [Tateyamaria omphalii]|uniref:Uncharacterized protein n=1 Tax=Tateyamaria omphalii TaxID=299262 RepID=A0A1P8MYN7_9RHOB|nr:hypothetical protein [Tateyamaria omphalii]APX13205.1 hypothetical protein BWR18_17075 [Tateyamaria omphalii]